MLVLDKLTYCYRDQTGTPYSFDLELNQGEICGITGSSGSGKSTLLDLISGFILPDSGSLTWEGTDLIALAPELRPVTILFQNNNLFEHLTAAQNIAVGMKPSLKLTAGENETVNQALDSVGLARYGTRRAGSLSGGEQQRIALARALVRDKPVLLLDEPFNGLDEDNRADMLKLVREIAEGHNRTIIMVTHNPRDCAAIANQHFNLSNGRLELQS